MARVFCITQTRQALAVTESVGEAIEQAALEDQIRTDLSAVRTARILLLTLAPQSPALRVVEANVIKVVDRERSAQERLETVKIILNRVNQYLFLLAAQKAEDPNEAFDPAMLTTALMQVLGPVMPEPAV